MKEITVVGMGMSLNTVTDEGLEAIAAAPALFGSLRLLSLVSHLSISSYEGYTADRILAVMEEKGLSGAVLLVSGDTGFYSASQSVAKGLSDCTIRFIPGVSSLSYFFAKLSMGWQDVKIMSCHGREGNVVDTVRRNYRTFLLTGSNRHTLAGELRRCGFGDLTVFVGENLGAENEEVYKTTVEGLNESDALTVLLIENPHFEPRVRFGIPDDSFVRGEIPMTKAEVRAVTMSKLAPKPGDVCYDLGCGTGSVTAELALAAYEGQVFAIDKKEEAIDLTKENCRNFHIGNITTLCGCMPKALDDLPPADVVFIGGSSGQMNEIFETVLLKNPRARIAVNAISLETISAATEAFAAHKIQPDIVQIGISKAKWVGGNHLMIGQNPVYVISGGGHE